MMYQHPIQEGMGAFKMLWNDNFQPDGLLGSNLGPISNTVRVPYKAVHVFFCLTQYVTEKCIGTRSWSKQTPVLMNTMFLRRLTWDHAPSPLQKKMPDHRLDPWHFNKPSESNGQTTHPHGLARTCTHAHSLLPLEWQPWTAVSALLGLISMAKQGKQVPPKIIYGDYPTVGWRGFANVYRFLLNRGDVSCLSWQCVI